MRDLPNGAKSTKILATTIAMVPRTRLIALSEGIENPRQAVLFPAHGYIDYQGYHFSRPLTADATTARLSSDTNGQRASLRVP